jgi:hypothetical protein
LVVRLLVSNVEGGSSFIASTDVGTTTAGVSPMTVRPHDEVETMEELDDTHFVPSLLDGGIIVAISVVDSSEVMQDNPRHLSILSGSSSSSLLAGSRPGVSRLMPPKSNAFSAQSSASFSEKHTPRLVKSKSFDATFFIAGAMQTGGSLIRPCPVGVSLSGAGMSFPHPNTLRVGKGEMVFLIELDASIGTFSITEPDFLDSSSDDIGIVICRYDFTFVSLISW